jgi:putative spermidine/putrescine transport system ATP-binding protein
MKNDFDQLRLDGVTRRFADPAGGEVLALDGLSLVVRRGEFIALLGPSGCGKSTALRCIAGLLPLTRGSIWLDDTRIDGVPPERRGFGVVFQNYALFPHMSVGQNVAFGLRMRGVDSAQVRARVDRALGLVRLEGQKDKLPAQLSGGQQQRVALARAIVVEPPLVLMDEPLSSLDAELRVETRAEIRRIHAELGRTTIYVTHDQDEGLSLADRVVVLRAGVVQQVGAPDEVHARPANLHVARFLGYRNVIEFAAEPGSRPGQVVLRRESLVLAGTPQESGIAGRVVAAIRPEDLSIEPQGPDKGVENGERSAVAGVVTSVEPSGLDARIQVAVGDGVVLTVRAGARVVPGDRVYVRVVPERVLVYPADVTGASL